jgi:hypothetical protein
MDKALADDATGQQWQQLCQADVCFFCFSQEPPVPLDQNGVRWGAKTTATPELTFAPTRKVTFMRTTLSRNTSPTICFCFKMNAKGSASYSSNCPINGIRLLVFARGMAFLALLDLLRCHARMEAIVIQKLV